MKKTIQFLSIITMVTVIGFGVTACDISTGGGDTFVPEYAVGNTGPGGGIIVYISTVGFTVTGAGSFTAHYLEAAPANQGTSLAWASSSFTSIDIPGTGTAIGTGRANTAAILAIDANAPAAKTCDEYSNNGKTDWFLPSADELNAMFGASSHLGNATGMFWSSSQDRVGYAYTQIFSGGVKTTTPKYHVNYNARAIRAF